MTDVEKDKMIAAVKALNARVKDAEGIELQTLLRNKSFMLDKLFAEIGLIAMLREGLL